MKNAGRGLVVVPEETETNKFCIKNECVCVPSGQKSGAGDVDVHTDERYVELTVDKEKEKRTGEGAEEKERGDEGLLLLDEDRPQTLV